MKKFVIPQILQLQKTQKFTPRIRIEPFKPEYYQDIYEILIKEPQIMKLFPTKQPSNPKEYQELFINPVFLVFTYIDVGRNEKWNTNAICNY